VGLNEERRQRGGAAAAAAVGMKKQWRHGGAGRHGDRDQFGSCACLNTNQISATEL